MIGNELYCSHNNALAALKHSSKCVALILINCMIGHGHAPLKAISFIKLEDETVSLFTAKSRISRESSLMFDFPEASLVSQIKIQELMMILLLPVLLCWFTSVI